ncbi:hypothetical protein STSP_72240 [Streptomyces jeddahensis]|uniref:Uncharacterized protein n=1 Tax=Streptomyces jeddahensis TaxID=1716141 RepID=A0A177HEL5_9ACTN|nr:hypothetical protein STSP_72240 [Streptomyces jeddahensis]
MNPSADGRLIAVTTTPSDPAPAEERGISVVAERGQAYGRAFFGLATCPITMQASKAFACAGNPWKQGATRQVGRGSVRVVCR